MNYSRLPLIAVLIFSLGILLMIGIGSLRTPVANPFAAMDAYMPGQDAETLEALPNCERSYQSPYWEDNYYIRCTFADGSFSIASVTLSEGGHTIKTVFFTVRPGTMQAGDLARWFDGVQVRGYRRIRILNWKHGHAWCSLKRWYPFSGSVLVYAVWFDQ